MLTDYAQAQAVGICWAHHFRDPITTLWEGLHPGRCEWCDWPQAEKIAALDVFNTNDALDDERRQKAWFRLPGPVRLRLIREAQGSA